jgi:SAM-dependent methyltransferase
MNKNINEKIKMYKNKLKKLDLDLPKDKIEKKLLYYKNKIEKLKSEIKLELKNNKKIQKEKIRKINITSLQTPIQATPSSIAWIFNENPVLSIKIDGIFWSADIEQKRKEYMRFDSNKKMKYKSLSKNDLNKIYSKFIPIIPKTWYNIQGEYLEKERQLLIFYFEIEGRKWINLEEMYNELEKYYSSITGFIFKKLENIGDDLILNLEQAKSNILNSNENNLISWFPKKYRSINTKNWNLYLDIIGNVFDKIRKKDVLILYPNDGLVISQNNIGNENNNNNIAIKLKPKEELTIDLFYNGYGKFFSSDKILYNNLFNIDTLKNIKIKKGVYRCYPDKNKKYLVGSLREPGKKANPSYIIDLIVHLYIHYFDIRDLKDNLFNPWYGNINTNKLKDVIPIFNYVQDEENNFISTFKPQRILDIGCGAGGNYVKKLANSNYFENYVGLDKDLVSLFKGRLKVFGDTRFKFLLMDINVPVNEQNEIFKNNLWNNVYEETYNKINNFDTVFCFFSLHYAASTINGWNSIINEINKKTTKNAIMGIFMIDSDLLKEQTEFYEKQKNKLIVNLPHRPKHEEPLLSSKKVISSFNNWNVIREYYNPNHSHNYISALKFLVLQKNN